jgi:hypothetical protein
VTELHIRASAWYEANHLVVQGFNPPAAAAVKLHM